MIRKSKRESIVITCAVLMAFCAGAVSAGETAIEKDASKEVMEKVIVRNIESPAPAASGLMVVRDAETGELRAPTAAEWENMAASFDPLNRSDAGLVERHYPDGRVSVVLQGRVQSMALIHRDAVTGENEPSCTHSLEAAGQALAGVAETDTDSAQGGER